jgi:hypothetical protein
MNPYENLPPQAFWKASIQSPNALGVNFDCGRKFAFSPENNFVTAGSCFAQHFAKQLTARGGNVLVGEQRHPLIPEASEHGYGLFSARYGNIYTVRQLLELLEQAFGIRPTIYDTAQRKDGRWVDVLRPRAVPMGFASEEQACADRDYHLHAVRQLLKDMDVFVFTLGLTETWINVDHNYCYPVVPGAIAGDFSPQSHVFKNLSFTETVDDLRKVIEIITGINSTVRILFTVSPVGLVATAEPRSVIVSTSASKSILRAAVDEVIRGQAEIDYFPSYEIITSPYSEGRFWAEGLRDVTEKGVATVMEIFFNSRMPALSQHVLPQPESTPSIDEKLERQFEEALTKECDEMFLDPALRLK